MKPINGWTKAKIVDHIKTNFKGKAAVKRYYSERCLYRTPDGKKCAAGLFIPDDLYSEEMEETEVRSVINKYDLHSIMPLFSHDMRQLQEIHDDSSPEQCLDNMINFVETHVEDV